LLIAAVVMAGVAGLVLSTPTDPDLWGHVTFGRDIVHQTAVTHVPTYSFTADRPWINHEWLSEVLMYAFYAALGPTGLIALKVLVCAAAAFLVVRQLSRHALTFEMRVLLFVLAVLGTKAQTDHVRPQLFSIALFALLLSVLTMIEDGDTRALVALPAIFLFWANLHGGWIVGAGVLAIWTVVQVLDWRTSSSYRRNVAIAAVASAAATLINPFGLTLWTFLLQTVRIDRAEITDWQPVTYSIDIFIVWLLVAAACTNLLFRARRIPPFFPAITLVLLGLASFRLLRLESFFALSAALLLPSAIAFTRKPESAVRAPAARPVSRETSLIVSGLATCAIAGFGVLTFRNSSCISIETGNPEPEATSFVELNRLSGRMITWFDWGEFAIWHFAPAIQVSLDGRRETAYSAEVVRSHLLFYLNQEPAGSTIADRWNADYVWLPKGLPVVSRLRAHDWVAIFEGPVSTILSRKSTTRDGLKAVPYRDSPVPSRRCFPGP
jgi:hypothetical protein